MKIPGRTHSENLMPMITKAFEEANLKLKDIDLLVCDKGPGSFTGVRIGVATIKAFSDSLSIPCIGVNSLEALAYSVKSEGFIASIIDCKNDNCYFAMYKLENGKYKELIAPCADNISSALEKCQNVYSNNSTSSITFVGDGSVIYKTLICEHFENAFLSDANCNILNSYHVAIAGLEKYKSGKFDDVLPLYLKKPQAQKLLEEKYKNVQISSMALDDLNTISDKLTSDFDEFWSYNILLDELKSENSKYLVAKFNGEIIGFAGLKILVEQADIMNIVIRKDFRNQGIGTMLLKDLIDLAKNLNLLSVSLEVMEENYPAIHLYKKLGFLEIGLRKNYYKDKNGIIMELKI